MRLCSENQTTAWHKPLGQDPKKNKPFVLPVPVVMRAIAGVLGLCLAVLAGWILFVDEPFGGEPLAVVSAVTAPQGKPAGEPGATPKPHAAPPLALPEGDKPAGKTQTVNARSNRQRHGINPMPT